MLDGIFFTHELRSSMYQANGKRYEDMEYFRCGKSGIKLPRVSLGLWHNFGSVDSYENQKQIIREAFDYGITHFDLANNYGPVYGSAETNFGRIMKEDMQPYRDEMVISTKAGYDMWPGPYGNWGSRKYLMASLDQSLQRMGLEYVDIFYHHRPDPETPLEETMDALSDIVHQGKALYVGISNYHTKEAKRAIELLRKNGTPCLIHQARYNMLDRWVEEDGLLSMLEEQGTGVICFSPLAQGLLTDRYKDGIPQDSRVRKSIFLSEEKLTEEVVGKTEKLRIIAQRRGQTLAEMALAWILRGNHVTSVLIGASRVSQLQDNLKCLDNLEFSEDELLEIDRILE